MPDIGDGEYLIAYWQDIGLAQSGGFGSAPLSCLEVEAWQRCTGICLEPWEFKILRDMSRSYLSQLQEGEKPECPPPYGDPVQDFDREAVSKKVSNAFKAFILAKHK